jgi:hypothetical protein
MLAERETEQQQIDQLLQRAVGGSSAGDDTADAVA